MDNVFEIVKFLKFKMCSSCNVDLLSWRWLLFRVSIPFQKKIWKKFNFEAQSNVKTKQKSKILCKKQRSICHLLIWFQKISASFFWFLNILSIKYYLFWIFCFILDFFLLSIFWQVSMNISNRNGQCTYIRCRAKFLINTLSGK